MSETLEMTCARNPKWAAEEIERLRAMPSETALTDEKGRPMTYWGGAASPDKEHSDTPRVDALVSPFDRASREHPGLVALARQLERDLAVANGLEQMAYDQRDKAFDKLNAMQSAGVARSKVMSEYQERADLIADFEKSGVPSATARRDEPVLLSEWQKAMKLLQQAADGLYNGFEPDNQSSLWLRINAFLKSEATDSGANK
jgi:hypothetical protein